MVDGRNDQEIGKPGIVAAEEWQRERDELLEAEKEATRALDRLDALAKGEHRRA